MSIAPPAPALLLRATGYRARGRVHVLKDWIGAVYPGPGEDFIVFRKMVLDRTKSQPVMPGAIFTVRFRFARLSTRANQRLSLIPAPFIAAQPGFRSKTWMVGKETGTFQGVYEWDTVGEAEAYWTSFPMKLMKRRAAPDSLWHEIVPT